MRIIVETVIELFALLRCLRVLLHVIWRNHKGDERGYLCKGYLGVGTEVGELGLGVVLNLEPERLLQLLPLLGTKL